MRKERGKGNMDDEGRDKTKEEAMQIKADEDTENNTKEWRERKNEGGNEEESEGMQWGDGGTEETCESCRRIRERGKTEGREEGKGE